MKVTAENIRELCAEALHTHRPAVAELYVPDPGYEGNEFLIFLKPDLIGLGDRLGPVWSLISERLESFGVELAAAAALDADVMRKHRLIQQHYGVINSVSMEGVKALSQSAKGKLGEFLADLPDDTEVLGAQQFMDRYPVFSPTALSILYDNLTSHRFGGGTYGVAVRVYGRTVVLLNGFHPEQIELFESPDAAIMCFVGRSPRPWRELRQEMTGATDPARAGKGSIRYSLLDQRNELGLGAVTPLRNGVHVSAGPVEAVVEIARYFSPYETGQPISPKGTSFGTRLLAGVSSRMFDALVQNKEVLLDGVSQSSFDATEELDTSQVLELLRSGRMSLPE
jgi:hypothetical protein